MSSISIMRRYFSHFVLCLCMTQSLSADVVNQEQVQFRKVNQTIYTVAFFWDVFEATLYLQDSKSVKDYGQIDMPIRLSLNYMLDLSRENLIEAANKILYDLYGAQWMQKYKNELNQLNNAYRSVSDGDDYTLTYIPQSGMMLSRNGKDQIFITNTAFAKQYLNIWLGNHEDTEDLSEELLRVP